MWIDTTDAYCRVGISKGEVPLVAHRLTEPHRHMESLAPMVRAILQQLPTPHALQGVAINRGPGSFMGVRIGIAFIKGFLNTRHLSLKTFTTFDWLQKAAPPIKPTIWIAHPTARRTYAFGTDEQGRAIIPMNVYSYDQLKEFEQHVRFVGSAPLPPHIHIEKYQTIFPNDALYAATIQDAPLVMQTQLTPLYIAQFIPSKRKGNP